MTTIRLSILAACAVAALAACGGGGGGGTGGSSTPPSVSAGSANTVSQLGLTATPGTSPTAQVFDLAADIGDTWRVTFNQDSTYTLQILQTQYALPDAAGTFTKTLSGDLITYVATGPTSFTLKVDARTKTVTGTVSTGGKLSSIAGTGYSVPSDLTKLAGDYLIMGSMRNASNGQVPFFMNGALRIAASGTTATICQGGTFNASGTCTPFPGNTLEQGNLTLAQSGGLTKLYQQPGNIEFGVLSVQAGDRGPVLVIDRYGFNTDPTPIMRTGLVYAVKQQALAGTELNGTWTCTDRGSSFGTVTVNGTALTSTVGGAAPINQTLSYNKGNNADSTWVSVNGIATAVVNGEAVSEGSLLLPLSSSLFVAERDGAQSVGICSK